MWRIQLVTSLTEPFDPEWNRLTSMELIEGVHEDRKRGFLLSREALRKALEEFALKPQIADLKVIEFHSLIRWPELTISLSHSKHSGAALVASRLEYQSVGIDVEMLERNVKDSIRNRIEHPSDDKDLRNLELWCLKEAAFKALMNTGLYSAPQEFASIEVSKTSWRHSPSGLSGECQLITSSQELVALAFLKVENFSQRVSGQ